MFKTFIDMMKAMVVLLLITAGVIALPFFLAAIVAIFILWIVYVIIVQIRLNNEKEQTNGKA